MYVCSIEISILNTRERKSRTYIFNFQTPCFYNNIVSLNWETKHQYHQLMIYLWIAIQLRCTCNNRNEWQNNIINLKFRLPELEDGTAFLHVEKRIFYRIIPYTAPTLDETRALILSDSFFFGWYHGKSDYPDTPQFSLRSSARSK